MGTEDDKLERARMPGKLAKELHGSIYGGVLAFLVVISPAEKTLESSESPVFTRRRITGLAPCISR